MKPAKIALYSVIQTFTKQYISKHNGLSVLSQLIMNYVLDKPKIANTKWISNCRVSKQDQKVTLTVKANLKFSFHGVSKENIYLNGYLEVISENKYLMLFDYKTGKKLLDSSIDIIPFRKAMRSWSSRGNKRESVYSKRVIELYLKYLDIDYNELKELHRKWIEKYIQNLGYQYTYSEERQRYIEYELEWNVLSMKLMYDVNKGNLKNVNRKRKRKTQDICHMLYVYLCRHSGAIPESMYVDDLSVEIGKTGKELFIKLNGKNVFQDKRFKIKK